jgi:hypothetical protein
VEIKFSPAQRHNAPFINNVDAFGFGKSLIGLFRLIFNVLYLILERYLPEGKCIFESDLLNNLFYL